MMYPKLDQESFSWILAILLLSQIQGCICQSDASYETCRQPFRCANLADIKYPFYGKDRSVSCGYPGFELDCQTDVPLITMNSISYRVLSFDGSTSSIVVARDDLLKSTCPQTLSNTTLDFNLFNFYSIANDQNITLNYGCRMTGSQPPPLPQSPPQPQSPPSQIPVYHNISCDTPWSGWNMVWTPANADLLRSFIGCSNNIFVPVHQTAASLLASPVPMVSLQDALASGFSIQWLASNSNCKVCEVSNGVCGSIQDSSSFACHCSDGTHPLTCNDTVNGTFSGSSKGFWGMIYMKTLLIGLLGIVGVVTLLASIVCIRRRRRMHSLCGTRNETDQNVEKFLLNHGSLAPKRYSYTEINKITKSFSDKLGEGGYGSVYKGMLPKPDGRLVAVKLLTKTMSDGEEFINEVASISRTSHVNIVNLLGFCYERKKRALVYEYMPNKSLDKYIYENRSLSQLGWERMYKIAIGVARGLEYLHKGCNTRIVHFDIKPQNILLDEDFCPKISDFGLAKLCGKKQSILSMLGMRGTIGYIAPEVFSRHYGGVSHKSDVYSYGMMVVDMAGARHNIVGVGSTHSSESYFPDEIYKHVTLHKAMNLDGIEIDHDEEISMKMLLVALWCIQTVPSDRPSISKVVEMLEGSLKHIQIPPKPLLFTPEPSWPEGTSLESLNVETENSVVS